MVAIHTAPRTQIIKVNPTPGDVHVDEPLTQYSLDSMNESDDFVWDKVFPLVRTDFRSGVYYKHDLADRFRIQVDERAPGTIASDMTFRLSTDSYTINVIAGRKPVHAQTLANADAEVAGSLTDAADVAHNLALQKEVDWVSNFFATGIWDVDLDGVSGSPGANQFKQWDKDGGTFIKDIRRQKSAVKLACGKLPNKLVLGYQAAEKMVDSAEYIDRVKATLGLSEQAARNNFKRNLAALLDLEEVLVTSAIRNTAAESATASNSFIGGKNALLTYAAPSPSLRSMTGGITLAWTGLVGDNGQAPMAGMSGMGHRIKRYTVDEREAEYIEGQMAVEPKLVASSAGAFFEDCVS